MVGGSYGFAGVESVALQQQITEKLEKLARVKASEALAQYRSFLARASQSDARRKEAEERVRELAIKDDR